MSSPGFEILTFANEILNCCNRYPNEPLEADKNSLDWWRANKEGSLTLARRPGSTCVPGTSTKAERVFSRGDNRLHSAQHSQLDGVAPEQKEAEHVRGDFVHATFLERYVTWFCEH